MSAISSVNLSGRMDDFEINFYKAVKHLSAEAIVDYVRSIQIPPGRAFKIRKIDDAKSGEADRSSRLNQSLVILANGTIFYTGKQGGSRFSIPDGKLLGRGANKLVFQVFDLNRRQFKAIAVPLSKIAAQIVLPSMKNEAAMSSRVLSTYVLSSSYFSRMTKSGKELGYLESELCFKTLKQMLDDNPRFLAEHPEIVTQVAKALHSCHRAGIAHLDAGKENILLAKTGDGRFIAKLADFGSAQRLEEDFFEGFSNREEDDGYLQSLERDYRISCQQPRRF